MHDFSRNPEMYAHMEGTLSLYRDINKLLKSIHYHNLRYADLIRPGKIKKLKRLLDSSSNTNLN